MPETVPMVTTRLSFIGGSLRPKGFVVNVPEKILKPRSEREGSRSDDNTRPRNSNLVPLDKGKRAQPVAVMAAIAPTGPNPVQPQQVPADAIQFGQGHYAEGALLVAEGSEAERNAPDPDETINLPELMGDDGVEEEAPSRIAHDDPDAEPDDEHTARAATIIEGSVAEVEKAIVGLDAAGLDAVERAEQAGQQRAGVANAIKAARGRLPA